MPVTMRPHLVVQMDVLFLLLLPFVVKEVAKEVLAADEEAAADVTTAEAEREEAETFGYYPESMGDCSDESLRSRMPIFTNTGKYKLYIETRINGDHGQGPTMICTTCSTTV